MTEARLGTPAQRPGTLAIAVSRRLLSMSRRLEIYEQIALATESGMREAEAVRFLWRVRTRDGRRGQLNPVSVFCAHAAFAMNQEGRSLPEVVLSWSSGVERPLLTAASAHGGSADTYRKLAEQMRAVLELRKPLGSILANAALLLMVVAGIGGFLAYYFFPAIEAMVDSGNLRGSARSLYLASGAFRDYWPFMAAACVLATVAVALALPRLTGPVRDAFDVVEPFRTYRKLTAGMFIVGAAVLMEAGVNERQALALLRRHASPYLAERIRKMERVDALFGERLERVGGVWPDHRTRLEAAFAASTSDPVREYARIGAGLLGRTARDCERLSALGAWISNFLLVGAILWILAATNELGASMNGPLP